MANVYMYKRQFADCIQKFLEQKKKIYFYYNLGIMYIQVQYFYFLFLFTITFDIFYIKVKSDFYILEY